MNKTCVECGTVFQASPSAKIVTCCAECRSRRRSRLLKKHTVSDTTRCAISTAAKQRGQTGNLLLGTPAAQKSPLAGRFETNINAKTWTLMSPDGTEYVCTNLLNWCRNNAELFGFEQTDENAARIANGLRVIWQNTRLNRRGQRYHGWIVVSAAPVVK